MVCASYSLPLAEAGRFGLFATLAGLFALVANWERHIDIQRGYVRESALAFDSAVARAIPFWLFNTALLAPVLALLAHFWLGFGPALVGCALLIVMGEQLSNQAYNLGLFQTRYSPAVIVAAARNVVSCALLLGSLITEPDGVTLERVIWIWAFVSLSSLLATSMLWLRGRKGAAITWAADILTQHRASFTHFVIGAFAMIALQFDRLAAGGLLPLDESGVYFRHVLIVSLLYQAFNIATFNRLAPTVFGQVREGNLEGAKRRLAVDYLLVVALAAAGFAAAWGIDAATGQILSGRYHLSMPLSLLLLVGAAIRAGADLCGLLFNASHQEKIILSRQFAAFTLSATLMLLLGWLMGPFGVAAASAVGSAVYLLLLLASFRLLPAQRYA